MNLRLIHEEESNIYVGSLTIWCKQHFAEIIYIALPSVVIMSFLHQLSDFALKLLKSTTTNGSFCTAGSRFSYRLSLKDLNRSWDWPGGTI